MSSQISHFGVSSKLIEGLKDHANMNDVAFYLGFSDFLKED